MTGCDSTDDIFKIIGSYFGDSYLDKLIKHHLESYNNFIENECAKTVEMFNPIIIHSDHDFNAEFKKYKLEIEVNFKHLNIYKPLISSNLIN